MTTIGDLAYYVRSKNAGPFWVTIDIFCDDEEKYKRICASPNINQETVAAMYHTEAKNVKIFFLDDLKVIKISYPRFCPQGGKDERDMHGGQQYIEVLALEA